MRNGKSRKEVYFSSTERATIAALAKKCYIDETSMIRVLMQCGINSFPIKVDTVGNTVQVPQLVKIEPQ